MTPVILWELVVTHGPSLATKGFQIGTFSQSGLHLCLLLLSLLIMMLGYLRAQEIPQKKGKWWRWCSMSLIWDEQVWCCRWCCLWEEREKAVFRKYHCESGDVNPKSWTNFQLHSPGVYKTHMGLVWVCYFSAENTSWGVPQDHCGAEPATGKSESCMQCVYFHTYQTV